MTSGQPAQGQSQCNYHSQPAVKSRNFCPSVVSTQDPLALLTHTSARRPMPLQMCFFPSATSGSSPVACATAGAARGVMCHLCCIRIFTYITRLFNQGAFQCLESRANTIVWTFVSVISMCRRIYTSIYTDISFATSLSKSSINTTHDLTVFMPTCIAPGSSITQAGPSRDRRHSDRFTAQHPACSESMSRSSDETDVFVIRTYLLSW